MNIAMIAEIAADAGCDRASQRAVPVADLAARAVPTTAIARVIRFHADLDAAPLSGARLLVYAEA